MIRDEFMKAAVNRDLFRKKETESFKNGTNAHNEKLFEAMDEINFEALIRDNFKYLESGLEKIILSGKGCYMLAKACRLNLHKVVGALLTYPEEVLGPTAIFEAAKISILCNSIESFKELITCGRVDWNAVDKPGNGKSLAGMATHYHRVEMVQALSKVEGVIWDCRTPFDAIVSLEDSCHQILEVLKNIPDIEINAIDGKGHTVLEYAFMKRDIKSIMILFSLPQLDLKEHDICQVVVDLEDLNILIEECHKAYRETGFNYSDIVDFLTDTMKVMLSTSLQIFRRHYQ